MENTINFITVRNNKLDLIRCIGIFLVILAHVEPPPIIQNIRTFDVVALVFISGISYVFSKRINYKEYIIKRIKKLLLPTYFTITFIFTISYILCIVVNRKQLFDSFTIIQSYLFLNGIAYIWIVKVFLMIAIVNPLLNKVVSRTSNDLIFIGILIIIYVSYIIGYSIFKDKGYIILDNYLFYAIPYSIISILGMRCAKKEKFLNNLFYFIAITFILIYIITIISGNKFIPSLDKYPPRTNYFIYGLFVSILLFKIIPDRRNRVIRWISEKSFTIYLSHIIILMGINLTIDIFSINWLSNWFVKYWILIIFSISPSLLLEYFIRNNKYSKQNWEPVVNK